MQNAWRRAPYELQFGYSESLVCHSPPHVSRSPACVHLKMLPAAIILVPLTEVSEELFE